MIVLGHDSQPYRVHHPISNLLLNFGSFVEFYLRRCTTIVASEAAISHFLILIEPDHSMTSKVFHDFRTPFAYRVVKLDQVAILLECLS